MDGPTDFRARLWKRTSESPSNSSASPYNEARNAMVDTQLRRRGISDPATLAAMSAIPRHEFVPSDFRNRAYDDAPVPIGEGQTISQPYIVAAMTVALRLTGQERVLEI